MTRLDTHVNQTGKNKFYSNSNNAILAKMRRMLKRNKTEL